MLNPKKNQDDKEKSEIQAGDAYKKQQSGDKQINLALFRKLCSKKGVL